MGAARTKSNEHAKNKVTTWETNMTKVRRSEGGMNEKAVGLKTANTQGRWVRPTARSKDEGRKQGRFDGGNNSKNNRMTVASAARVGPPPTAVDVVALGDLVPGPPKEARRRWLTLRSLSGHGRISVPSQRRRSSISFTCTTLTLRITIHRYIVGLGTTTV